MHYSRGAGKATVRSGGLKNNIMFVDVRQMSENVSIISQIRICSELRICYKSTILSIAVNMMVACTKWPQHHFTYISWYLKIRFLKPSKIQRCGTLKEAQIRTKNNSVWCLLLCHFTVELLQVFKQLKSITREDSISLKIEKDRPKITECHRMSKKGISLGINKLN